MSWRLCRSDCRAFNATMCVRDLYCRRFAALGFSRTATRGLHPWIFTAAGIGKLSPGLCGFELPNEVVHPTHGGLRVVVAREVRWFRIR